ncbi:MAG: protein kinase domain-containing protein, partial [Byssovorax sp.]
METLDDRIARDGPVKELDAVGWAIRLAKRLEALHSLGVAHGSVSPACILTGGSDRTSRAYIADVQVTTSSLAFQSPERVLGGDLSPADDTWAVACTLYTALTGTSPFVGANDAETKQRILGGSAAPLAVFDVGDDDLQHILDGALTRELGGRISSVTALRSALEEWHPDPSVGALSPLDDDDASEGDEDMRTVMRPAPAFLSEPRPASAPMPDDDDDDDEDQATRMREFTLPAGLAASAPFGGGAPYAPAGREGAPRPAAGRPHDGPSAVGFNAAPAFGGPGSRPGV